MTTARAQATFHSPLSGPLLLFSLLLSSAAPASQYDILVTQYAVKQAEVKSTVVDPCLAMADQKAAQIRDSISQCACSAAQKQEETDEVVSTLRQEHQNCEKRGESALWNYRETLAAKAQDDFIAFTARLQVDRQVLANCGFDRTVDEMEAWTQYGIAAQATYTQQAQNELISKVLQGLQLKLQANATTPRMSSQKAVSLYKLFVSAGVKDQALLDALAAAGRGEATIPEEVLVKDIGDQLGKLNELREMSQNGDDRSKMIDAMLDVAGWLAPELAPELSIAKDSKWIGYAIYTHAEVADGLYRVSQLSTLTADQLRELQTVTSRLKQDVDGLVAAKQVLNWTKSAGTSSTELVRFPSQ